MYMNALIDIQTRYVVGWSLSNSLDTEACLRTLEKAIESHGLPDIINSDQGSQFTSQVWVNVVQGKGILISMSGRGRSNDNAHIERLWRTLKYEWTMGVFIFLRLNLCYFVGDLKVYNYLSFYFA